MIPLTLPDPQADISDRAILATQPIHFPGCRTKTGVSRR
jgi:hypothetical protein